MRKIFLILAGIFLTLVFLIWYFRSAINDWWWLRDQPKLPEATMVGVEAVEDGGIISQPELVAKPELPQEINLAVPFTSQAPFARWDHFDEEMCEEASLLMVNRYHQKRGILGKEEAQAALEEIQKWEEANLNVWESTTAEQVVKIAREMLGYQTAEVVELTDFQAVKEQIAAGHPIILPTAGRKLGNPNFRQPGPIYHMLVIRGWLTDGRIITNDPGTRRGEGYIYSQETLWQATADWDSENKTVNDKKMMIVIK